MKERPILFSGPMVKALLAGTKTQTRRALQVQDKQLTLVNEGAVLRSIAVGFGEDARWLPFKYGQPGDRLWVKETWSVHEYYNGRKPLDVPEGVVVECKESPDALAADGNGHRPIRYGERGRWRPSIFMRRWMSRITLEIVGVRVERLNDISEADAIAEGIERVGGGRYWLGAGGLNPMGSPVHAYRSLWEHINGAGSWDANPFVWVIEFRKI